MRIIFSVVASLVMFGCATQPNSDPVASTVSGILHPKIVTLFDGYAQVTDTKVLAACIKWPEKDIEELDVLAGGWYYTAQGSDMQIFAGELSDGAMQSCESQKTDGGHDCTCQFVDKNGKNVLSVPGSVVALIES